MRTLDQKVRNFAYISLAVVVLTAVALKPLHRRSREDVERAHGLSVPITAAQFQQRQIGVGFLDHGILSVFELPSSDVAAFIKQLQVTARSSPIKLAGSPLDGGWNVWPTNSQTFVPGDRLLSGLKQSWKGPAKPIEMLSCKSSKGDWLHVEIWEVEDRRLIKLYTDWN